MQTTSLDWSKPIGILQARGIPTRRVEKLPTHIPSFRTTDYEWTGLDFEEKVVYLTTSGTHVTRLSVDLLHEGSHVLVGGDPRFEEPEHLTPIFALDWVFCTEAGLLSTWSMNMNVCPFPEGTWVDLGLDQQLEVMRDSFDLAVDRGLLPSNMWAEIESGFTRHLLADTEARLRYRLQYPGLEASQAFDASRTLRRLTNKLLNAREKSPHRWSPQADAYIAGLVARYEQIEERFFAPVSKTT